MKKKIEKKPANKSQVLFGRVFKIFHRSIFVYNKAGIIAPACTDSWVFGFIDKLQLLLCNKSSEIYLSRQSLHVSCFYLHFPFSRYSCIQHHPFGAGWLLRTLITSYPTFLSVEEPRFVIFRFEPINCPDSYGGGSIPAHAMSAFALCATSPISAINLTARDITNSSHFSDC